MDAELVDLLELADDRLHGAWIDVGTPDQLHVVDSSANAAFVDVEGASAAAGALRHADHEITGPISQDRDHPATERGDQPLAQFAVTNWVAGRGVDHLFDVVVLDDVRPAWLLRALEDHDGAHLGHAGGIRRLRTPLFLDEALGCRNRAGRLTGEDQPFHRAAGQVDAHRPRLLRHPQGVGRGGTDDGGLHAEDLFDAGLGCHVSTGQHEAANLFAGIVGTPEADEGAVAESEENDVGWAHPEAPETVAPHLRDPLPVLHAVQHLQRYPASRS